MGIVAERRVGLLWDSASPNMGDQAIGLVLQRALTSLGIGTVTMDPFSPGDLDSLATVVIGGGELIRRPGNEYYDCFRARGPCILNSVGVLDGSDTEYLEEYLLVTVRTEADRKRLGCGEVVPCLTMLMGDFPTTHATLPEIPEDAFGIHVNFAIGNSFDELAIWLREQDLGPVVFLPLTHYNADFMLMQSVHLHVPNSILLPQLGPDEAFSVIGKLRGFLTCSLHGAIFAYSQQIPFTALRGIPKIGQFLDDRGIRDLGFAGAIDAAMRLARVMESTPNLTEQVARDKQRCRVFLDQIQAVYEDRAGRSNRRGTYRMVPASRMAHMKEMGSYRTQGEMAASRARAAMPKLLESRTLGTSSAMAPANLESQFSPTPATPQGRHVPSLPEPDSSARDPSYSRHENTDVIMELMRTFDRLALRLRSLQGMYENLSKRPAIDGSRPRSFVERLGDTLRRLLRALTGAR